MEDNRPLTERLRSGFGGMVPPICDEAANEIDKLRAVLNTAHQTVLEVMHAQEVGSNWYTRGANGLYQQVSRWTTRAFQELKSVGAPFVIAGFSKKPEECGHEHASVRCMECGIDFVGRLNTLNNQICPRDDPQV